MSKHISIDEAVASAMTLCNGATDSDKVYMRHWAVLGNRELGLSKDNVEDGVIKVQDLTMRKPENCLSINDFGLYDDAGFEYAHKYVGYGKATHTDLDTVLGSGKYDISVSEDADFLHFSSNGANVTYVKINYYSVPVDDDGNPLIIERKRLAITFFINWMWEISKGSNQAAVDRAELRWLREAAKQRAKNKMPSVKEAEGISEWYMSLISTPPRYRY